MTNLIGRTIENVRPMTDDELRSFGWTLSTDDCPAVLELDDGSILLPSRDPEENGPGVLVGEDGDGEGFWLPARSDEQGDGVYDPDACQTCDGEGALDYDFVEQDDGTHKALPTETCPDCDGTGDR